MMRKHYSPGIPVKINQKKHDGTSAYIEFTEAYSYPEDATANNYLEVSVDGGMSWDSVYVSIPDSVGEDYWFNTVEISQYAGSEIMFAFRYYCALGYGESWFVDDITALPE